MSGQVRPLFSDLFTSVAPGGRGGGLPFGEPDPAAGFDGVQYFSSSALHCPQCSVRQHANGSVTYSHMALTPVLVKPGLDKVIPLAPEFVRTAGRRRGQADCESTRPALVGRLRGDYSPLGVTLLGDDLSAMNRSAATR